MQKAEPTDQPAQLTSTKLLPEIAGIDPNTLKEQASLIENYLKSGTQLDNTSFEELKKNYTFDDKSVLEMLKNSKKLDKQQLAQIEKVFSSKGEKIPQDALDSALNAVKQLSKMEDTSGPKPLSAASSEGNESDDDVSSEDESDSELNMREGHNLLDSVKENIDNLLSSNNLKHKSTKKRWWTPEEVLYYYC